MPKGRWPRGVTPCPRSGAVAESARLRRRGNGREELPKSEVRGGGQEELPKSEVRGGGREVLPKTKVRGGGWEELPHAPTPKARGSGWEDQPHVQGTVVARAQEGLEELSHVEGQEVRW